MPRSVTIVPHNARWADQAQGLMADLHVAAPGVAAEAVGEWGG